MSDFAGRVRDIIIYGSEFTIFFDAQSRSVQDRILWVLRLLMDLLWVPEKYLKHITGTDGIYELRVSAGNNIYRIFCFFDQGRIVILLNAFQKKSQKIPIRYINKAKKLKQEYYDEKKKQHRNS